MTGQHSIRVILRNVIRRGIWGVLPLAGTVCVALADTPGPRAQIVSLEPRTVESAPAERVLSNQHLILATPGTPRVKDLAVFHSTDGKLVVDISRYDPVTLKLVDWPVDELMFLIDGKVQLSDEAGHSHLYGAGDTFLMPAGFSGTWKQLGAIRKVAVTYFVQPTVTAEAKTASAPSVRIVDISDLALSGTERRMKALEGWDPYLALVGRKQGQYVEVPVFSSRDGKLAVHVKRFEPIEIELKGWPIDEFMHLIRGHIELDNGDGTASVHGPGSSFVIPKGFSGHWRQPDTIDMVTVAYDRGAAQ